MERSFVFGTPVEDYNFTGREKEINRLCADFEAGINVILISPRRMGKTSLVKRVCKQMRDTDIIPVFVDIFGCKSEYDFYNMLAAAVLKQTANKQTLLFDEARDFLSRLTPKISVSPDPSSDYSISLGITPKTHSPEEILSLAEDIARKKNRHIVVCIDEFQQIGEFGNSAALQGRLRSVWQHQQMTSYCLFGSKRHLMSSIFHDKSMPFYQFGDLIWLNKIDEDTWVDYITSHFDKENRTISDTLARQICHTVDCYSAYIQQLAWYTFQRVPRGQDATPEILLSATKDLVDANEMLFMQQIEPLTGYQMNLLRAIVSGVNKGFNERKIREQFDIGSPSNFIRLKTSLAERDLIYQEEKCLYISDPVFALWFKSRYACL